MSLPFPLFPPSASTVSTEVDLLYLFITVVSAFFVVLVAALVAFFAIRYRRRAPDEVGADIHGSLLLELTWTFIPFALAMVMFFWGADLYFRLARPPVDAMEIFVVGKQWMWKVQHPTGQREINEMHVPVGRNVRITMSSEDVIHDYSIPAFRVKMDVVPGKLTTLWFNATTPGTYQLFCAEYCGTNHSGMIGQVVAMEPEAYEAWLSGATAGPAVPPAVAGEQLFTELGCATCHRGDGLGLGPSLVGLYGSSVPLTAGRPVVADDNYLRESIMVPAAKVVQGYQPVMPPYQGRVTEEQLLQLIAFIRSLQNAAAAPAAAPAPAAAATGTPATAAAAPAAASASAAAQAGEVAFNRLGCAACHRADVPGLAPPLGGVFGHSVALADGSSVVADDAYLRESIRTPAAKVVEGFQPVMPPLPVTDEELEQLLAYIKALPAAGAR
jgi:cytochrome c oxidase subunit 2